MEEAAAFLLTIPGPKLIWEFGELGYDFSINRCIDGSINNSCRLDPKPIRWDYLQVTQRKRLYDIYSSLLKLRAHSWYKDVFIANNTSIVYSMGGVVKTMLIRSANDTSMLAVLGNFDVLPQVANFTFPTAGTWYDYLNGTTFTTSGTPQSLTLQPGEYRVFLNRNLVNAVVTPVTNLPTQGKQLLVNIYPNPVLDNSVLEVDLPVTGKLVIEIIGSSGQKVSTVFSGTLAKGTHGIPVNQVMRQLAAGQYIIKASSNSQQAIFKFVKNN
jgi:hypothetical protein